MRRPLSQSVTTSDRLVKRYSESDLSNVSVGIRVPHREAIPVRSDARVPGETDVIAQTEKHSESAFALGERSSRTGDGTSSDAARQEKTTGRRWVEADACVERPDRQR